MIGGLEIMDRKDGETGGWGDRKIDGRRGTGGEGQTMDYF